MMRSYDLTVEYQDIPALKIERITMLWCVLLAGMICIAQILGNRWFLMSLLTAFLLLIIWSCGKDFVLPVFFFFLPWSALLKLSRYGFSFFTFALLLACICCQVRKQFMLRKYQILLPAVLAVISLVGKALQGNSITLEYLFFFVMLVLFPSVTQHASHRVSFWSLTIFFALGIISAALSAQYAARFPNIMQYITVESYHSITRLSGYYGDPNYYSAHITACAAGVMLLLNRENDQLRRLVLLFLFIVLMYCGLLSASKSFVVVMAMTFMVWIPTILRQRNKGRHRARLLLGVLVAGIIMAASPLFQSLFRILDDRFAYAANVSQLTTGRTDIWVEYLRALAHDPLLLLFGEGYSSVVLFRKVAHNSLIQLVLQFGIIGIPFLFYWLICYLRDMNVNGTKEKELAKHMMVMLVGVVGPWLGLDILFFDEFFLLPVLMMVGASAESSDIAREK